MKKSLALTLVIALLLVVVAPAFAWTGVTGQAIDDKTKLGWTHGGDVYILNNATGDIEGTGTLNADGSFTVAYGVDGLGCGCVNLDATAPASGNSMSVFILFNNGGLGTPGTGQVDYNEAPIPAAFNVGYVNTGTGPTAINLQSVGVNSVNTLLPAAVGLLLLAGASFVLLRRRQNA